MEQTSDVEVIDVIDNCEIEIEGVKYNKQKNAFIIKTKNLADIDCWVDLELNNVLIDDIKRTLGTEGSTMIEGGKTKNIYLYEELTDEDLGKNSFVDVVAYFGEREDSLVKIFKGRFEVKIETLTLLTYSIIALIIIIIALIIIIVIIRRREEEEEL